MTAIMVSPNPTIAAQQLAAERDNIQHNDYLRPEAKEWHIKQLERAFANAQYSHTLSVPARIAWILVSLPSIFVRILYDMPNIIQYGLYGGHGRAGGFQGRVGQSEHGAMIEDQDSRALTEAREHES